MKTLRNYLPASISKGLYLFITLMLLQSVDVEAQYARIEHDNVYTWYDDWTDPAGVYTFEDATITYIRFYADESCTTPATLSSDTQVKVFFEATQYGTWPPNTPMYSSGNFIETVPANTSEHPILYGHFLSEDFTPYATGISERSVVNNYQVVTNSETSYIPLPAVRR